MRYVKWGFWLVVIGFVAVFLHYNLPRHDIVRIVGTEVRRVDFGENSIFWAAPDVGTASATSRDVRFINSVRPNGKTLVFRNEDTGWGWPPYFKLDSSDLQAQAESLISTSADPIWVSVTRYGWRSRWLTIYPNAVGLKVVPGPDTRIIPWGSIIILTLLVIVLLTIRAMWRQFRQRSIDPLFEDASEAWDDAEEGAKGWFDRFIGRK
ncbi:hypothetical protein BMI91_06960 [Thioclava sediminum]|uniref:DUF1523 family protein n=2 Tax=Thioclava TaxID=285107 RepID=A0ABX6YPM7_9RHOB|nr:MULTISPECIES: DUF1523 family protein [Thioclava]MAQ35634.1 DUF1523 domain-containing protein [Thioclava sp.]OOY15308.1 hypothetical protein BMI85_17400 [Thioclava sp. DLFJ4-1]OOY26111.1 hypothetical protein BMI91_06960 [Thioclava sediminum]QPZ89757.1 DUF1523 family protein [Thioclava electrotropha]